MPLLAPLTFLATLPPTVLQKDKRDTQHCLCMKLCSRRRPTTNNCCASLDNEDEEERLTKLP
ncbi:hypothetical protein T4B_3924 [Trichinella pseudospiralis]|nr:hypothetical protein T4B_3924 [Trichinella pseudospiralis]